MITFYIRSGDVSFPLENFFRSSWDRL